MQSQISRLIHHLGYADPICEDSGILQHINGPFPMRNFKL
jgi:hypothetical protein